MYHIATKKQLDFNMSQIVNCAHTGKVPEADLANEAGVIFLSSSSKEILSAEKFLTSCLSSDDQRSKFVAYCQLKRANGTATDKTHETLEQFTDQRENMKIVEIAQERLWI